MAPKMQRTDKAKKLYPKTPLPAKAKKLYPKTPQPKPSTPPPRALAAVAAQAVKSATRVARSVTHVVPKSAILNTKVTRRPHVPSASPEANPDRMTDFASKKYTIDMPKQKLLTAVHRLMQEVTDRRIEQKKLETFIFNLQDMCANSGVYTVAVAGELVKRKTNARTTKTMSTSTKPTILGRLMKLTSAPGVIAGAAPDSPSLMGSDSDSFLADAEREHRSTSPSEHRSPS